jgi:hypothetical protein
LERHLGHLNSAVPTRFTCPSSWKQGAHSIYFFHADSRQTSGLKPLVKRLKKGLKPMKVERSYDHMAIIRLYVWWPPLAQRRKFRSQPWVSSHQVVHGYFLIGLVNDLWSLRLRTLIRCNTFYCLWQTFTRR